jgi:hypothetical protein
MIFLRYIQKPYFQMETLVAKEHATPMTLLPYFSLKHRWKDEINKVIRLTEDGHSHLLRCLFKNMVLFLLNISMFLFSSCKEKPLEPDEMKDAAGNRYKTVTIGHQMWMAENLNALYINKSNSSTLLSDAIGADFWFPDDDPATMSTYGLLYSLSAAKALLPKGGWRIPTLQDFDILLNELRSNYDVGGNAVVHASKIYD